MKPFLNSLKTLNEIEKRENQVALKRTATSQNEVRQLLLPEKLGKLDEASDFFEPEN